MNSIIARTSTSRTIPRNSETLGKSLEPGPAQQLYLDDICSDLSSLPPTPRQNIKGVEYDSWGPPQPANTSPKVKSDLAQMGIATLREIPSVALQTVDDATSRPRGLARTLVGDAVIVAINTSTHSPLLDRQNCTPRHILL